jgi:hypothetical protein
MAGSFGAAGLSLDEDRRRDERAGAAASSGVSAAVSPPVGAVLDSDVEEELERDEPFRRRSRRSTFGLGWVGRMRARTRAWPRTRPNSP